MQGTKPLLNPTLWMYVMTTTPPDDKTLHLCAMNERLPSPKHVCHVAAAGVLPRRRGCDAE
jgi:hypothetical protein